MSRLAGTVLVTLGAVVLAAAAVVGLLAMRSGADQGGPTPLLSGLTNHSPDVTNENISFFQGRVERDPADFVSYSKLGAAYVQQARETGDLSAYQRAEAALRRALEIQPTHPDALASLASVLLARHDFTGALALAQQLYATDPSATGALATMGDARIALGAYDDAYAAYAKLAELAAGPSIDGRLSHLAELRGDTAEAIALMEQAERGAVHKGRSVETIAFYRLQLGTLYFNSGNYDDAERWFSAALDVFPDYYQALARLGDVATARGDLDKAVTYYEQSVAAVPQPAVLARLGDVYTRLGDHQAAQEQYDTVEFIGQLAAINRTVYNRELALFYADHGIKTDVAVQLAQSELEVRKDIYGYDAAAWALDRDGRPQEAATLMQQAFTLGTKDARLLYHAGMIERDLGHDDQAREYLKQAIDLNPQFSPLQASEARQVLAKLSEAQARAHRGD